MRVLLVGQAAEHGDILAKHLAAPADVIGLPGAAADSDEFDAELGPDDIVVSLRFTRARPAPPIRLLHVPGAGLDQIDFGILDPTTTVANVFEHETPIAEFTLARLLEWEIRATDLQKAFRKGDWADIYRNRPPHGEVAGRTMGLIGYGRIGRAIAARAAAFGIEVTALDERATGPEFDDAATVLPSASLPDVLSRSDYLVIACPLTPATEGLIDAAALHRMPRHALLINVSRGPVVDQWALYEALHDGVIGGAVLDVWYRYPGAADVDATPSDAPLRELPNAWCTPHCSAWTSELPQRRYAVIAENINRLAAGEPLRNVVHLGSRRS